MDGLDANMTLAEWAEIFLKDYASVSCKPSAVEHYADNLYKHIIPEIGALSMKNISTADIQTMLRNQEQHGNLRDSGRLSAKSLRNMRTVTSACFAQAVETGLISANPVTGTVVRKASKPKVDVMEEESLRRLRDYICTDGNLMNAGIILAAEFALRRGEICALRWRDYDGIYLHIRETVKRLKVTGDPAPGELRTHLVFNSVKTDSSERDLAVSPANQEFLEAQRHRFKNIFGRETEPDDFIVYSSSGGLTDPDNLSHYFADLLDGLGLPHVKLHALRHTFASRAIEMGVDIDSVSGILGHSNVTTTAYYYLRPRQRSMNDALWRISGSASAVPNALPSVVRGREVGEHVHTRRKNFGIRTA